MGVSSTAAIHASSTNPTIDVRAEVFAEVVAAAEKDGNEMQRVRASQSLLTLAIQTDPGGWLGKWHRIDVGSSEYGADDDDAEENSGSTNEYRDALRDADGGRWIPSARNRSSSRRPAQRSSLAFRAMRWAAIRSGLLQHGRFLFEDFLTTLLLQILDVRDSAEQPRYQDVVMEQQRNSRF